MARNRKRAKERRSRRPTPASVSRPGGAPARNEPAELEVETPGPLEHAAPDAELAEAQLALGRPDLARDSGGEGESEPESDDFDAGEDYELEADEGGDRGARNGGGGTGGSGDGGHELAAPSPSSPARSFPGHRLFTFLQGSWRELQRVQWPDRRQVIQATGVVIGFVIVAGVYLGIADTVATRLMNFILK